MKKKISFFIWLLALLAYTGLAVAQDTITISKVTTDLKKHYLIFQPLIDYVAKRLNHMGVKEGEVFLVKDNAELVKFVRQGRIDIVTESLFSSIYFMNKAGMKILLRRWKKGVPVYHSVIFVRKDSGINALADLKGNTVAFEDPGSTTGYFLPKAEIIKHGFKTVELHTVREKVPADKVGYCFAKTEVNVGHWVHKGWAAAGALDNITYNESEEVPADFIADFKIIYRSEDVPRYLMLVRGDMDPKVQAEIKKILLGMESDEEGKKVLQNMEKTAKFDEFSQDDEILINTFMEKYQPIIDELK